MNNLAPGNISHQDDLYPKQYIIRMTYDATLSHKEGITKL